MTPGAATAALTARTREVDPSTGLLDALGPDGFAWLRGPGGLVTAGVAARVAPAAAIGVLRSIEVQAGDGPGPVAVGALPFDRPAAGMLTVPARAVRLDTDGRAWLTETGPAVPVGRDAAGLAEPAGPPGTDRRRWTDAVGRALAEIGSGRIGKVVLARESWFQAPAPIDRTAVLRHLHGAEAGCFVFADAGFVGASPELLVRRSGGRLTSRPMAGTVPVGADRAAPRPGSLLRSGKDRREHEIVVQAVVETFERLGVGPVEVDGPTLVSLATVAHLATHVDARVGDAGPTAVDAALALHPTPAVGGTPVAAALDMIAALEPSGRGRYAGPVGWVDAAGDGEFAVAIRSAEISGARARLHAGAGIVSGSDASAEWDETEAKLEPMRRALRSATGAGT